jgi:uncharacterized protein
MALQFVWDARKAAANLRKPGVSFTEAAAAFGDPLSITMPDPDHSQDDDRFLLIGQSARQHLVIVAHVQRGDTIRIISARLASRRERIAYEEGQ